MDGRLDMVRRGDTMIQTCYNCGKIDVKPFGILLALFPSHIGVQCSDTPPSLHDYCEAVVSMA
jgi:hypothetical protein